MKLLASLTAIVIACMALQAPAFAQSPPAARYVKKAVFVRMHWDRSFYNHWHDNRGPNNPNLTVDQMNAQLQGYFDEVRADYLNNSALHNIDLILLNDFVRATGPMADYLDGSPQVDGHKRLIAAMRERLQTGSVNKTTSTGATHLLGRTVNWVFVWGNYGDQQGYTDSIRGLGTSDANVFIVTSAGGLNGVPLTEIVRAAVLEVILHETGHLLGGEHGDRNQFFNYNNLQTDLMNALAFTGQYRLGLNFVHDQTSFNFLVDMGTRQVWSEKQMKAWLDINLPYEPEIVKVLVHFRGVTKDGICLEDTGSNVFSVHDGLTYRNLPTNGTASAQVTVIAKNGCSVNSAIMRSQNDIKNTFVHEMGHGLAHPGAALPNTQCATLPTASIMCHNVKTGSIRHWQKWGNQDISLIRNEVFDNKKSQFPVVSCYEWSSFQACDNQCINTAGFPNQGATEVYNNCLAQNCRNICR